MHTCVPQMCARMPIVAIMIEVELEQNGNKFWYVHTIELYVAMTINYVQALPLILQKVLIWKREGEGKERVRRKYM
jgi:hypothetical protein